MKLERGLTSTHNLKKTTYKMLRKLHSLEYCNLRWLAAADAVNNGNSAAPAAGCKTLFHGALDMSLHRA